jgi:phenylalanyl-tRNA synthetase beta chain
MTQINNLLGSNFTLDNVKTTLSNVGFDIAANGDRLAVTAPYWRTDIHIPEDNAEEVGRLNGFDNIKTTLPLRGYEMPSPDKLGDLKAKIRNILAESGGSEVLTYSFVDSNLLKKAGQTARDSYKIINSISPDLEYYRQSLIPSLLDKIYINIDAGFSEFALFELNKVSPKSAGLNSEKVPVEKNALALIFANTNAAGDAYYEAKQYLAKLLAELNVVPEFVALEGDGAVAKPFEPKRAAAVIDSTTKKALGVVGELRNLVLHNFDLPKYVAGFELDVDKLAELTANAESDYAARSRYPSAKRDITLKVAADVTYGQLETALKTAIQSVGLWFTLQPVDIYQGQDKSTKNITFHLELASFSQTLGGKQIANIIDVIVKKVKQQINVEVI